MDAVTAACVIRGMQETLQILVDLGVVTVPLDKPKERAPATRKPPAQRAKVGGRSNWPPKGSRKFGA